MPTPVRLAARVVEIIEHADDLRSFLLQPERPLPPFRPGQFLHLAIDPWTPTSHWPESRVFSIASSPFERERLRVTVSRKGAFTTRMFEELAVDARVWLKLPYGTFCPTPGDVGKTVLLAGGSGITPFVSVLEWAAVKSPGALIDLHYGARRPSLLVYREVVERHQAAGLGGLRLHLYAEEPGGAGDLVAGRISADCAWQAAADAPGSRFYLSGPKGMIDALRTRLLELGAEAPSVMSDEWG